MRGATRAGLITLAVTATLVPAGSAAMAADGAPQPQAADAGAVLVQRDGSAIVKVNYVCTSTISPANHLFVAVKQGPDVSPSNPSSENQQLTAFYSTNWSGDSGPNQLKCDGKRHVQRVVLQPQGPGALMPGQALVQICVYDNVTGVNGYEPIGGFAPSYTMQNVAVLGH